MGRPRIFRRPMRPSPASTRALPFPSAPRSSLPARRFPPAIIPAFSHAAPRLQHRYRTNERRLREIHRLSALRAQRSPETLAITPPTSNSSRDSSRRPVNPLCPCVRWTTWSSANSSVGCSIATCRKPPLPANSPRCALSSNSACAKNTPAESRAPREHSQTSQARSARANGRGNQ